MVAAHSLLWGNVAEHVTLLLIGSSHAPLDAFCAASLQLFRLFQQPVKRVGSFNTKLRVSEDTDFFFRILSDGFVPVVVSGVHVVLHDHLMARLQSPAMLMERIRACEGFLTQIWILPKR